MKIIILFLIILCYSKRLISFNEDEYEWEIKNHGLTDLPSEKFYTVIYRKESKIIKFTIECSNACKIMLMTQKEFEKFRSGLVNKY
jgi:hypothetical protein